MKEYKVIGAIPTSSGLIPAGSYITKEKYDNLGVMQCRVKVIGEDLDVVVSDEKDKTDSPIFHCYFVFCVS